MSKAHPDRPDPTKDGTFGLVQPIHPSIHENRTSRLLTGHGGEFGEYFDVAVAEDAREDEGVEAREDVGRVLRWQ